MTRQIRVGNLLMGGGAPITVQSMCCTKTEDVEATVAQIKALERAGCEIVRVSAYNEDAARAIAAIKPRIGIPIVADIHFDHRLAILAAQSGADKLRINPGNIGSVAKVRELLAVVRDLGIPIRIGVNGGSLEKDILRKYGAPTAKALAESALGHCRILEDEGFFDIVLSVKSSDVKTTVEATRLLHQAVDYPLHLGVTEAGTYDTALVKSAVGLGALLMDGIGDTLRVSITGDPVEEPKAGIAILKAAGLRKSGWEIVSCPTCGRCAVDLAKFVEKVKKAVPQTEKYLKLSVMGCVVNGPGEARESDAGIAFAPNGCMVFVKGKRVCSTHDWDEGIARLIFEANKLLEN